MSLAERLNGLFVNRVSPPHRGGGPDHPGWGQLGLRCPSGHRKYRSRAPVIVGSNPTRPTNPTYPTFESTTLKFVTQLLNFRFYRSLNRKLVVGIELGRVVASRE